MALKVSGVEDLIEDFEDFNEELEELKYRVKLALRRAIVKTTKSVYNRSQELVPVDTSNLKQSGFWEMEDRYEGVVKYASDYSKPTEYGSGLAYWGYKYKIEPGPGKQVLKFRVNGETVFAPEVMHPGVEAQPYMRPALKDNIKTLEVHLREEVDKAFSRVF